VDELVFGPDSATLATSGCRERKADGQCDSGEVILWDVKTRQVLHSFVGHGDDVWGLAISPDGTILATGGCANPISDMECIQGDILLWDVETGQRIGQPLLGHPDWWVESLAFSPDGAILASGSDPDIVLWDVETRRQIGHPLTGHTSTVFNLAFSPDGRTLVSSGGRTVGLWDMASYAGIGSVLSRASPVSNLALSADGKTLAVGGCAHPTTGAFGCLEGMAHVWDLTKDTQGDTVARRIGEPMAGFPGMVWSVVLHPDGRTMVLGCSDGTIRFLDIQSGAPIREPFAAHPSWAWVGLALSPDGKVLASAIPGDSSIHLWNAETLTPIGEPLTGHTRGVTGVAFSPDGKTLASASYDGTVRLWDVETGQSIGEPLVGHLSTVMSIAFGPDGRFLASGGSDATVRLWNLETGQPVGLPLTGHDSMVWSLAFSPDGQLLASGTPYDHTIRLWEVATGKPIGEPLLTHTGVGGLAFSPDGRALFSGGGDGVIRQWNVDPASWPERACRVVGRNMTQVEWEQYMPGLPYRKTCAQWPAGE
jgi:WD40 repeat protein